MDVQIEFLGDNDAPLVISPAESNFSPSLHELINWVEGHLEFINRTLYEKGAILFRGFSSIEGAEEFEAVVTAIAPKSAVDDGSTSPRTQVGKRTYTSTDTPPYIPIELHQERSFNKVFPKKIAFFCDIEPATGGETPIVDMRLVYRDIPDDVIDRFEQKGVQLKRRLPAYNYVRNKAIRTWKDTFLVKNKESLPTIMSDLGWTFRVKNLPFGFNFYIDVDNPVCAPSTIHPITKDKVWFNQAHVLNTHNFFYWANKYGGLMLWFIALTSPLLNTFFFYHHVHGDGTEISISDLTAIRKAIASNEIKFRWQKGDVLFLDNIVMAHGRKRFSGSRRVLVSVMDD